MSRALRCAGTTLLVVAGVLSLAVSAVPAQPEAPPGPTPPRDGAAAEGELRVLVFVESLPAAGVLVDVDGRAGVATNADGAAVLTAPEGRHRLRLTIPRHILPALDPGGGAIVAESDPVLVVAGEQVEVIVTVDARGAIAGVDVESAESRAEERRRASELAERQAERPQGVVRGRLLTRDGEHPVAEARVFVRGAPVEAQSDGQGHFELALPEGTYDLTIIHPHYTTVHLDQIAVDAQQPKELTVALEKATPQLEDFVVTAPHLEGGVASLVAERRESASVDDVIGAAEMSRSGDSDAAGALKRVTGITVVGGQFVYVRGMGERYSATLLNGQAIPSPEPERRVIPLDLFSTDVLQSVVIQKTPSPDMPGEFGGGVVQLRTRSFPEQLTAEVEISTGVLSTATFQERPSYRGGSLDFLGMDDGSRALPAAIRAQSPLREGNRFQEGFTPEELAAFARLLPNNYNVDEETVPLDRGVGVTLGDRRELGRVPLGFLLSLGWDDAYGYREEDYRRFVTGGPGGELALNNDFRIREQVREISSSGILVAGAQPGKGHELRSTSMILRVTDDETAIVTGRSDDLGRDIRQARLQFVERQLLSQQLAGEHALERWFEPKLEWRLALSRAVRDEPDRREWLYVDESANPDDGQPDLQLSGRPGGNQRIWSELTDQVYDVGLDYSQLVPVWKGLRARAKTGATLAVRERDFRTLRLTLRAPRTLSEELRRLDPETIWSEPNLNADDGWILEDTTRPTDAYSAEQLIQAAYAMATVPLVRRVEVTAGMRLERSRQRVETFSQFDLDQTPAVTELDDTDLLPSATFKWQLTDEMVVRGGYGRSVTRPDFRELSESSYRDVITATRFVGNPQLVRGTIHNAETRLEYYFSTDEVASIGAFYKAFDNPIEQIDLGGVDRTVSWDNADSANNVGLELEARRRLGFLDERLDAWFAAANVALIRSQVNLGADTGVSTSRERPLQGQSPYVINAQLGYDDAAGSGITAVLLYNVFGRRIRDVGRLGTPDILEEPFHQLDFVYTHRFAARWAFKLKVKNILGQDVELRQGGEVTRRYPVGISAGASLSWSY